jgi:thiamine transport system permease protein
MRAGRSATGAGRAQADRLTSIAAGLATAAFVAVAVAPIAAAIFAAASGGGLTAAMARVLSSPSTLAALSFALRQAFASTLVAVLVGLPGAWLCARYDFPGRRLLKALSAVPFCIPPILVVLAFVVYYGRNGVMNQALMAAFHLGEPPLTFLYSFWGLVLVHGFYNFPIVLQGVGSAWEGIPSTREEAARTLGARPFRAFVSGSLPALAPSIVQASALVFLFCFFSFIVVLVFGPLGGTTLEVEIYRAARFKGDEALAASLAMVESAAALGVVFLFQLAERRKDAMAPRTGASLRRSRPRKGSLAALLAYVLGLILFFAGPLVALAAQAFVVKRGLGGSWRLGLDNFGHLLSSGGALLPSLMDSLGSALPAAILATLFGCLIALGLRERRGGRLVETLASFPLAVSGVVGALGWSLLVPHGGRGLIVLALAAAALPFTLRSVAASLASLDRSPAQAARTLGASRLRTALEIELPSIAAAVLSSMAFAFSMTAGDANAPLLLGGGDFQPLPVLIYRLVGAYRFPEASAAGLCLAGITGFVFFIKERRDVRP